MLPVTIPTLEMLGTKQPEEGAIGGIKGGIITGVAIRGGGSASKLYGSV